MTLPSAARWAGSLTSSPNRDRRNITGRLGNSTGVHGSDALPTFHQPGTPYQFTQNQFGGAGGGPVVIPGHRSIRAQDFFYTAYEGYRYTQSASATYITPNVASELGGNLSSVGNQIYNPYSVVPDGASPSGFTNSPFLCTGGAPSPLLPNKTQASGTPCNMIPAALIDQNMVTYAQTIFPAPNLTGNPNFNGVDTTPSDVRQDAGTLRIDHQFTERDNLWARSWDLATGDGLGRVRRAAAFAKDRWLQSRCWIQPRFLQQ